MKLLIRNMVCDRCRLAIQDVLKQMGVQPSRVLLGEVDLGDRPFSQAELDVFRQEIEKLGFALIGDKKSELIEAIKKQIIALVQKPGDAEKVRLSEYLSQNLFHDYAYLSNLFSSVEGLTIEQYFIHQKIEKVKELLVYDELTLTEISFRLGYSSVAHLSRQFKKVTGQTPSAFKQQRDSGLRKPLDKV